MQTALIHLSSLNNIDNLIVSLGNASSAWFVVDILKTTNVNKILIVWSDQKIEEFKQILQGLVDNKEIRVPENISYINKENLEKTNLEEYTNYVFDSLNIENEIIDEISLIKPKVVVGTLCSHDVDSFIIWEKSKEFVDSIYLFGWGIEKPSEVLYWEKNDIELSVILPMYNVAKYLPKCIETVTAWDAPYIEFLFVDDGSPDNCADIVAKYAKVDKRIKLLTKKNGGCASARQYGMENAKGRYIGFIDPDDYIDPSMYKKLLARAMQGSYEVSYCGFNYLYENTGEIVKVDDNLGKPFSDGVANVEKIRELMVHQRVAIWRGIYLKSRIDQSKLAFYTDLPRFDDLPFKVEVFSSARSVVSVPEYLYYYRLAREGQDVSADDERLYVHFDIFKKIDEHMQSRNKFSDDTREYVQLCKLNTHQYALTKLRSEFAYEYCTQAREDILHNMNAQETLNCVKKLGNKNLLSFTEDLLSKKYKKIKRGV